MTINKHPLLSVLEHLHRHVPLLESLDVNPTSIHDTVLGDVLFNRDLSSLRELCLQGVAAKNFPWKNLANPQVVTLEHASGGYGTTQILDTLESAPLLHTVSFTFPVSDPSDALPERMVTLCHLKILTIRTTKSFLPFLNHLHIPSGASLILEPSRNGDESLFRGYFPQNFPDFDNLSHITAINLFFGGPRTFVRPSGPSWSLRLLIPCRDSPPHKLVSRVLRPLDPTIPTTERLAIEGYGAPQMDNVEGCPIFQTFLPRTVFGPSS